MNKIKIIFLIYSFFLSALVFSAEIPIEEIIVNESKPISLIRNELLNAENRLKEIFNNLVGETEFKIICNDVVRAGSHIDNRECEPRFIIEARQRDYQQGVVATGNPLEAMTHVRMDKTLNRHFQSKRKEMENIIIDLAMENPELYNVIMDIKYLKQELEDVKENRFGD